MSSVKLSKEVSKRSKVEKDGIDKDGIRVYLFTGDRSKTDEDGSREIMVWEARGSDLPIATPLSLLYGCNIFITSGKEARKPL